jgi:hypothetical protein
MQPRLEIRSSNSQVAASPKLHLSVYLVEGLDKAAMKEPLGRSGSMPSVYSVTI